MTREDHRPDEFRPGQLLHIVNHLSRQNISMCWHCLACGGGCPFAEHMDLLPNQVIRHVQMGAGRAALRSRTIWICVGCHTCSTACPNRIDIAAVQLFSDAATRRVNQQIMGAELKSEIRVHHLMDLLPGRLEEKSRAGILQRSLNGLRYVPYYGCLLASPPELNHYPRLYGTMEAVMTRLGARQCRWSYQAKCCGAFLSVARPDIVTPMVASIVENAIAAGAECIVTACAMCQLNLELRSTEARRLPVFSIVELLAYGMGSEDWPAWFKKHLIDPVPLFEHRILSN